MYQSNVLSHSCFIYTFYFIFFQEIVVGWTLKMEKKILLAYVTPASQMFSVIIFIIIPPVIIIISYGWYDINQNVGIDAHMPICHLAIQVCDKLTLIKLTMTSKKLRVFVEHFWVNLKFGKNYFVGLKTRQFLFN